MGHHARTLTLVLLCTLLPGPVARAGVSADELRRHVGTVVVLLGVNGRRLEVEIVKVAPPWVYVKLLDGSSGPILISNVAAILTGAPETPDPARPRPAAPPAPTGELDGERPPAEPLTPGGTPDGERPPAQRLSSRPAAPAPSGPRFHVEWIGVRFLAGFVIARDYYLYDDEYWGDIPERSIGALHVQLVLFGLHWRHLYWEMLRFGGGQPFSLNLGTTLAYPIRLGTSGEHELRVGAHLSFEMLGGTRPEVVLGGSGAVVFWSYRPWSRFGFQLGLAQHSYPPGLSVLFGFSS